MYSIYCSAVYFYYYSAPNGRCVSVNNQGRVAVFNSLVGRSACFLGAAMGLVGVDLISQINLILPNSSCFNK